MIVTSSKKYISIGLVIAIALSSILVFFSTIKDELGLGSKPGVTYNKLSISEDEIDADLKAIANNKPLNELLATSEAPLVKDGKVTPVYRASWANIKMRTLAIKEVRLKEKLEVTAKDKKDAVKEAKGLFAGADEAQNEKIWDAFPESFQNRLVKSFAEQYALIRTAPKVSEKEIKAFFDENQATIAAPCESGKSIAHILVTDEAEAKEIEAQIKGGADFADLAKSKSTDPGSKENGGNLGCFAPGSFVPEFEAAAIALAPGNVSQIVKTDFGYHILKAKAFSAPTLEEARGEIVSQLESKNQSEVFDGVQNSLKKAKVKVSPRYGRVTVEEGLPVIVPLEKDVPATTAPQGLDPTNLPQDSEVVPGT